MLPTQPPPKNPFMYYSAFKLAIYFANNKSTCKPFHSVETKNTVPQIFYRKINEIKLDRRQGFYWCLETAAKMKDKIHHAILYSAYDDTIFGTFKAGKWYLNQEPDFNEQNQVVISKDFTIKNGFVVLNDIPANTLAIRN